MPGPCNPALFVAPVPLPRTRATRRPRYCACHAPDPSPTPTPTPTPTLTPKAVKAVQAAPSPAPRPDPRGRAGGIGLSRRAAVRLLAAAALAATTVPPGSGACLAAAAGANDAGSVAAGRSDRGQATTTGTTGTTASSATEPATGPDESDIDPATAEPRVTARAAVELAVAGRSVGRVVIGLYGELLPNVAGNFATLVQTGRYDDTPVYRVVPGLTVQLGDVLRNGGKSGAAATDWSDADEAAFVPDNFRVSHTIPGIVSMVRRPDGRVDSRFFVATRPGDSMYLDGKFAAFGRVVEGMDVLRAVERATGDGLVRKAARVVSCRMLE